MLRLVLNLALLTALCISCSANASEAAIPTPTQPPAIPTMALPTSQPTSLPQGSSSPSPLINVTYCTTNGVELKMDAYFPSATNGPVPAVIYVHGGSWNGGDKSDGVGINESSLLTNAGFAVFAVNYRLAPEYRFPVMIEDVKCAIRSIRAHAAEYNIDHNSIGAFGGSAGGHLVTLLGTSDASAGFDVGQYLEFSSRVQAVVDIFGPADFTLQNFSADQIQSASQVFTADQLMSASPVTYISPDDPPFLILHGDRDSVVPLEQSQLLYNKLISGGVPAELVVVQNAGHGFDANTDGPIQPSYMEISQRIINFFEQNLK